MAEETGQATMSNEGFSDLRARVVALEQWRVLRDIDAARHDERWKHLDSRFNTVETKINDINAGLRKIAWLMASAILAAFMAFVLRGGLNL